MNENPALFATTSGHEISDAPHGCEDPAVPAPPPFDPELELSLPVPSLAEIGLDAARRLALMADDVALSRDGGFEVSHVVAPGRPGDPDITLLVCLPQGRHTNSAVPGVYHVHGGGLVTGNRTSGLEEVLGWAERFGMAVVSVEYRLAPEAPHPSPVDDCYAGFEWTVRHAGELGIDPARIVVIGGSAGGGLAAAMLLMARDRGGPRAAGQVLLGPMLDDRNNTVSARQMTGSVWDWRDNAIGWEALLGAQAGTDLVSPYAAPARATDLSGLPPTFIEAGSAETFRDEAVAYASGIWQSGGVCELHVWPGGFHSFRALAPLAALSRAAETALTGWLSRLLGSPS